MVSLSVHIYVENMGHPLNPKAGFPNFGGAI